MNINSSFLLEMPTDEFAQIVEMGGISYGFITISPQANDKVNEYFYKLGRQIYTNSSLCKRISTLWPNHSSAQSEDLVVKTKLFAQSLFGVPKKDTPLPTFEQIQKIIKSIATPFETLKVAWKVLQTALRISLDRPIRIGFRDEDAFVLALEEQITRQEITPEFIQQLYRINTDHISLINDTNMTIASITYLRIFDFSLHDLTEKNGESYFSLLTMLVGRVDCAFSLDFSNTNIIRLPVQIRHLATVNLNCSNCRYLTELPTFTRFITSETSLDFSGCVSLIQIPANFPRCLWTHCTMINFSGCTKLETVSRNFLTNMHVKTLNLSGCISLRVLEFNASKVSNLNLTGCRSLVAIPRFIMKGNINAFHDSHGRFVGWRPRIENIDLNGCTALETMPGWPLRSRAFYFHTKLACEGTTVEEAFDAYQSLEISIFDAWCLTLFNPASKVFDKVNPSILPKCLRSKIARIFLCVFLTIITLGFSHLAKWDLSTNTIVLKHDLR